MRNLIIIVERESAVNGMNPLRLLGKGLQVNFTHLKFRLGGCGYPEGQRSQVSSSGEEELRVMHDAMSKIG